MMKNVIYMSDIKLLPCPFCGGEAELYEQKHKQYPRTYYVTCKSCHCKTIESRVKGVAISGWNTRKPMERIVEQLEEKALVKECDVGGLVPSREKIVILSDAIEIIKEGGTDETI